MEVLPAVLYVVAIFFGGSIPLSAPPVDVGLPFDKVLHFVAFGGMQILFVRAAGWTFPALGFGPKNWLALGSASGVGLLLELWQSTLPHRSADPIDWLADSAGAAISACALQLGARKWLERPPQAMEPR